MTSAGTTGPLAGVRVVDLSQIASGPYGTMILAEQGADVIKIEPIGMGDMMHIAPIVRGGLNAPYLNLNHGKRSIALDIAAPDGRDIVLDLIERARVVVTTSRSPCSTSACTSSGRTGCPTAGRLRQPRHAIRFADAPTPIPQSVPHIGEHTDEVLATIGRIGEEIAALRAVGVVA